jgi:anaerobic selenocysteine-containing dehydrogenase
MEGSVTLKVKIRSFPSHGRARVHESVLPMLEAKEGEALLIATYPTVWDEKTKTVAVTGYGDKQVDTSVIMLSPEDVAALGVAEGDTITVMRKVTWTEKISRGAAKAGETIKEGAKGVA